MASLISVSYRWNDSNPWIAIVDNGCGMSSEKLLDAMRFGGRINEVKLLHSRNALLPIDVTFDGIVTFTNLSHP